MTVQHAHTKDADCTVDPETLLCQGCGVYHGDPCEQCGGAGFHRSDDCPGRYEGFWNDAFFEDYERRGADDATRP